MSRPRFETSVTTQTEPRRSPYWGEHVARYRFAVPYLTDRRTLDVACGDGYGLPIIRERAAGVIGVDIDLNAARNARTELGEGPGQVVISDGCYLPFADASFDAITSFETLEHLTDRDRFLAELRRVLKSEGILILSTPNANHTLPINGKPRNPYHVHEYTPEELENKLSAYFAEVTMLGETLNPRFLIPPFWDEQEKLSKQPGLRKHILFWRAMNKAPFGYLRDRVSRALWGHRFLPSEADYLFSTVEVNTASVLVAVCHKGSSV